MFRTETNEWVFTSGLEQTQQPTLTRPEHEKKGPTQAFVSTLTCLLLGNRISSEVIDAWYVVRCGPLHHSPDAE